MNIKILLCLLLVGGSSLPLAAQADLNSDWTLQKSVQYAISHNISIRQNELNARLAGLTLKQSQLSLLPNANGSVGYGRSYGRSVDPTTNQFVNGSYDFLSAGANADVLVFGWFGKRNTIASNNLNFQAAKYDLVQLQNDVTLNVATGYLRALLAKEQITVNQKQVALSNAQMGQTRGFAKAGRVPELNVVQLESQLATDSSNLISAISDYNAAILDLKALLNLDFEEPFEVVSPDVDEVDKSVVLQYTPEAIYEVAAKNFGTIKSAQLRWEAAKKTTKAARSNLYPQLTLNAQLGTNYATTFKDFTLGSIKGKEPTGSFVDINGMPTAVYQPSFNINSNTTPLNRQLNNNFRQTYSVNLNIPLFNAWQAQTAVRRAVIEQQRGELNKYQSELTLRQDIYKAYNDARNSIQKYAAAERAAVAANKAFDYASTRYDLGFTNTVEYLTTQNNQYKADAAAASARYDLIFRLKVLDYYLGTEIKL